MKRAPGSHPARLTSSAIPATFAANAPGNIDDGDGRHDGSQ